MQSLAILIDRLAQSSASCKTRTLLVDQLQVLMEHPLEMRGTSTGKRGFDYQIWGISWEIHL